MKQPRVPAFKFEGPFLGLNTAMAENDLPPAYATRCRNLLLNDGRMQPRPPFVPFNAAFSATLTTNHRIVGGISVRSAALGLADVVICKTVSNLSQNAELWAVTGLGFTQLATQSDGLSGFAPTFVAYNGSVYVLDGSQRMFRTDGTMSGTYKMGLDPLPPNAVVLGLLGGGSVGATVSYAATLYNSVSGVESNPAYSAQITPSGAQGVLVSISVPPTQATLGSGSTHIRVYRRNHSLLQVGWRLLREDPLAAGLTFLDLLPESAITLSSEVVGPFAPSRNGIPAAAMHGVMWNGRLITDDPTKPGFLRYSGVGFPDHQDPSDFLDMSGDPEDRINGLAVLAGQLVAGKRRSIHVASGTMGGLTNLTVATGALPIESQLTQYKTRATIGPITSVGLGVFSGGTGPGFFEAGQPARLYFGGDGGLGMFDGADAVYVSDAIREAWLSMFRVGALNFSMVDDTFRSLLYITPGHAQASPTFAFARDGKPEHDDGFIYDYRHQRWSTFAAGYDDNTLPGINQELLPGERVSCVIGNLSFIPRAAVIIGGTKGSLLTMVNGVESFFGPRWQWRSGKMRLQDGFNLCVYGCKVYREPAGQGVPGGEPRAVIRLEIPAGSGVPVLSTIGFATGSHNGFAVQRTGENAVIDISNETLIDQPMGWREKFGVTGFEFDAELSGQR